MSPIFDLKSKPSLTDPRIKINWAKKHLQTFYEELRIFQQSNSHRVSTKDDLEAGEYLIFTEIEAVPINLYLILGDFISNLRAALDHIAWQLTRLGTPNRKAAFPIIGVDNAAGKRAFGIAAEGIPADAVKIIDSLQPYHHGDAYKATYLWALNKLWNIDKHRGIPIHAGEVQMTIRFPSNVVPISGGSDNSGIVRLPLSAKPYVDLDPTVKFDILAGDESEGVIVASRGFSNIYNFVNSEVFPRFKCFFE